MAPPPADIVWSSEWTRPDHRFAAARTTIADVCETLDRGHQGGGACGRRPNAASRTCGARRPTAKSPRCNANSRTSPQLVCWPALVADRGLLRRARLADGDAHAGRLLTVYERLYSPRQANPTPGGGLIEVPTLLPLRPDRLGEDLVGQHLAGNPHAVPLLAELLGELDPTAGVDGLAVRRCLIVLAAAGARHDAAAATLFALLEAHPALGRPGRCGGCAARRRTRSRQRAAWCAHRRRGCGDSGDRASVPPVEFDWLGASPELTAGLPRLVVRRGSGIDHLRQDTNGPVLCSRAVGRRGPAAGAGQITVCGLR